MTSVAGLDKDWKKRVPNDEVTSAGLCATCRHMRRVVSDRGSVFYLCELAKVDPRFEKYPRLPVLSCIGYAKKKPDG